MPEGDSIHQLAQTFDKLFAGQAVTVASPQGRFSAGAKRLDGSVLINAQAVGKHMFLVFQHRVSDQGTCGHEPQWLHVHLGLYGSCRFFGDPQVMGEVPHAIGAPRVDTHSALRWSESSDDADHHWVVPDPVGQVRVRILSDHGVADLSGPNQCELLTEDECWQLVARLGPDPLGSDIDVSDPLCLDTVSSTEAQQRFVTTIRSKQRAIGELLMDQSVVAGVGNIYRAETLFIAGINPYRKGNRVSEKRIECLWSIICARLQHGVEAGRIETVDPAEAPAPPIPGDEEASRYYVYHRTHRPCLHCGTPISEALMQSRRLFWCSHCQT